MNHLIKAIRSLKNNNVFVTLPHVRGKIFLSSCVPLGKLNRICKSAHNIGWRIRLKEEYWNKRESGGREKETEKYKVPVGGGWMY